MPGVPPDTVAQVKTRLKTLFNRGRRSRSRQPPEDEPSSSAPPPTSTANPAAPPSKAPNPSSEPAAPAPPPADTVAETKDVKSSAAKDADSAPAPPAPPAVTVPAPPTEPKVDEHGMSATSGPLGDHLAGEEFGLGAHEDGEEVEEVVGSKAEMDGGAVESKRADGGVEGEIKKDGEVATKYEGRKEDVKGEA